MKASDIARKALELLWDGESGGGQRFICIALKDAEVLLGGGEYIHYDTDALEHIKELIHEAIDALYTYEAYLCKKHSLVYELQLLAIYTIPQIQQMRRELLISIIEKLEEQGQ
jgi:hypothetical protein